MAYGSSSSALAQSRKDFILTVPRSPLGCIGQLDHLTNAFYDGCLGPGAKHYLVADPLAGADPPGFRPFPGLPSVGVVAANHASRQYLR
jgi:hypothetical protein